jgi:hypothetical protein
MLSELDMNDPVSRDTDVNSPLPFGAQSPRARWPVVLFATIFGLWVLFLAWMIIFG